MPLRLHLLLLTRLHSHGVLVVIVLMRLPLLLRVAELRRKSAVQPVGTWVGCVVLLMVGVVEHRLRLLRIVLLLELIYVFLEWTRVVG